MKRTYKIQLTRLTIPVILILVSAGLMGCPELSGFYDAGFAVGFADDDLYWQGYDDSWDTRDGGDIYYSGSDIPYLDDGSYQAGYWDGMWYAYNDGYFVAYDYAFVIGFTEGYDATFRADWLAFLRNDTHVEWLDGGFSDGYNDGFSEGRILGAVDYIENLPYDWEDALLFYKSDHDAYIPVLDLGTGEYGPVYLYDYGVDPLDIINGTKSRSIRKQGEGTHNISYRNLLDTAVADLDLRNATTLRGGRTLLNLDSTWLERINAYNALYEKSAAPRAREHAVE